jgi:hypothetical protein
MLQDHSQVTQIMLNVQFDVQLKCDVIQLDSSFDNEYASYLLCFQVSRYLSISVVMRPMCKQQVLLENKQ